MLLNFFPTTRSIMEQMVKAMALGPGSVATHYWNCIFFITACPLRCGGTSTFSSSNVIDVEANYMATKVYQFTSITSVMLLDCWTIPCVLLLTWLLLKTRYLHGHFIDVSLCVLGLGLVLLSDVQTRDRFGGSNALLGDTLVFVVVSLYAVTNVFEEFLVWQVDRVKLLAMFGGFGAIVSACQVFVLERRELEAIHWSASAVCPKCLSVSSFLG